jgi:amicoumacin kinase
MDPEIKSRFNDNILQAALQRFEIDPASARLLDGFESFIYEYQRDGQAYILRLGHSQRRSEALIQAEVDWINYLADGGATVSRAVLSGSGKLVERVPDGQGQDFLATAFLKAPGRPPQREDWTLALYRNWGALLGRMHALAKTYPQPAFPRYAWDDPLNLKVDQQLPPEENTAAERYYEIMDHLHDLPVNAEGYGMIHQDAHSGNFYVDPASGQITLFDFDDCCYGHFIYDIAMVIFYHCMFRDQDQEFMTHFLANFFTGYRYENQLDPSWLVGLPYFIRLREVDLYAAILHSFTAEEIAAGPWLTRFMHGRKESIANRAPFILFPWDKLSVMLER